MSSRHFAIVLSAGLSRRMGQDKASLPWLRGQCLLEWTIDSLTGAGWLPVVVLGPHNYSRWREALSGATPVLNSHAKEGKTTSIAAGIATLPLEVDSILLTGIDQPCPPHLYRRLRVETERCAASIIAPDKDGRCGHPIVCHGALRNELAHLQEDEQGLRGLLKDHHNSVYRLACDPAWLQWNINTPAVYEQALEWFRLNVA